METELYFLPKVLSVYFSNVTVASDSIINSSLGTKLILRTDGSYQ